MKIYFSLVIFCLLTAACSQPLPVTTTPNEHTTTSGTMGSVKATQSLPDKTIDTTATKDSIKQ